MDSGARPDLQEKTALLEPLEILDRLDPQGLLDPREPGDLLDLLGPLDLSGLLGLLVHLQRPPPLKVEVESHLHRAQVVPRLPLPNLVATHGAQPVKQDSVSNKLPSLLHFRRVLRYQEASIHLR
jgi:hypothetical protein